MHESTTSIMMVLVVLAGCGSGSDSDPDGHTDIDVAADDSAMEDSTAEDPGVDDPLPEDVLDTTTDTGGDVTEEDTTGDPTTRWVSGYYVGYQRELYPPEEVDFGAMTHVMVGRIEPAADGSLLTHFDIDDVNGPIMARDMAERAHAAGIEAILMVGGAGVWTWSDAASDANRATFVANLIAVMEDYGYDGLDLDWEPIAVADQPSLRALAEDLRAAAPGIILTIPLGWVNANSPDVDEFYGEIAPLFDQVNLMTYSMAGDWSGWESWHSSALTGETPSTPSSVQSSIEAYMAAGIPAGKLGIGIGFYGSCWSGVTGPHQTGHTFIAGDNVMSYANIMSDYHDEEHRLWDDAALVPFLSFPSPTGPRGCTFVSYDDPESIAEKGAWVHEAGLGGAIIWTINQGYIASNPAGNRNPPLEATRDSILLGP